MPEENPLYDSFKILLETRDLRFLDAFAAPSFWENLDEKEKTQLSFLFLEKAALCVRMRQEEGLFEALQLAEESAPFLSEIFFQSATHAYHWAVLQNNKKHFIYALNKLLSLHKQDPEFFSLGHAPFHLWGNILLGIGNLVKEESFVEEGIQKFQESLSACKDADFKKEILWDLGEAYTSLGQLTREVCDFEKALEYYQKTASLGMNLPHFWLDYGESFLVYGLASGKAAPIKEGAFFFKKIIADGTPIEDKLVSAFHSAYARAWYLYASASKAIAEMTYSEHAFEEASSVYHEAFTYIPEERSLSLQWAELCIRTGYLKKDPFLIDKGLEHLLSFQALASDFSHHGQLLVEGILILGILLDDLPLIKEGGKRLALLPPNSYLFGLYHFAYGVYFSEEKALRKGLHHFEETVEKEPDRLFCLYMVFEAAVALFELQKESKWLPKALKAIALLCEKRPSISYFFYDWGIILLKIHQSDRRHPFSLEVALSIFKKAIALGKEDVRGLLHYGMALRLQAETMGDKGALKEAIDTLLSVRQKIPHSLRASLQLGLAYFQWGDLYSDGRSLLDAASCFEEVLKSDKEDDETWFLLGKVLWTLSIVQGSKELKEKAKRAFSEAQKWGNLEVGSYLMTKGVENG